MSEEQKVLVDQITMIGRIKELESLLSQKEEESKQWKTVCSFLDDHEMPNDGETMPETALRELERIPFLETELDEIKIVLRAMMSNGFVEREISDKLFYKAKELLGEK